MRALCLLSKSLTYVMQQSCTPCHCGICADLVCNNSCEQGNLYRMAEHVLTEAGAVTESAEEFNNLGMNSVHARFKYRLLTRLLDGCVHITASLLYHFLNLCRVNTSVCNQLFKCEPCNLPAYGVKARNGDNLRRIIDNKLNARESFYRADISTLSTDYPSLHFLIGQADNGYCHLADVVSGTALNRNGKNVLCPLLCLLTVACIELRNFQCGFVLDFTLHSVEKLLLRLARGNA